MSVHAIICPKKMCFCIFIWFFCKLRFKVRPIYHCKGPGQTGRIAGCTGGTAGCRGGAGGCTREVGVPQVVLQGVAEVLVVLHQPFLSMFYIKNDYLTLYQL